MKEEDKISDAYGKHLFIIDEETRFLFWDQPNSFFIVTEKQFNEVNLHDKNPASIIILAEPGWPGKILQQFYGFDIALHLRRKAQLSCPIIIVSTFPRSCFEQLAEKEIKYNIIFGRGTFFLHVDELYEKLQGILDHVQPVPLPVLADINEMLLNVKGVIIDRLTHDLRAGMESEKLKKAMAEVAAYLNKTQSAELNWPSFENQLFLLLGNAPEFYKVKDELLLKCEQSLTDISTNPQFVNQKRHRIMILEDDADFAKQIEHKLTIFFDELIVTDKATEAIRILNEDHSNSIIAIIADWRLYADVKKKYWQIQGYEVLDHASKTHLIALFGLTSLSDRNVNNIRNMLGLNIHLFKKSHYLEFGSDVHWGIMADTIHQKCDEIIDILSSLPTGSNWEKYKREYIAKRNINWKAFEYEIENEATRIFNYYRDAILNDNYRNVYSLGEMGLAMKNNLRNILIIRRIYLGLYFMLAKKNIYFQDIRPAKLLGDGEALDTELKHHSVDAYSLLRKDWWDDNSAGLDSVALESEWGKFDQRMKNLRNGLCIELALLPARGLLPEEKNWLNKNNIDFGFLFNYWSID